MSGFYLSRLSVEILELILSPSLFISLRLSLPLSYLVCTPTQIHLFDHAKQRQRSTYHNPCENPLLSPPTPPPPPKLIATAHPRGLRGVFGLRR